MNGIFNLKAVSSLLKKDKTAKIIVFAGIAVLIVFFFAEISALFGNKTDDKENNSIISAEISIEKRLAEILSQIDGVGKINIMLTLEGSEESIIGERSIVTGLSSPYVRGVVIVCDGGGNVIVKQKLVEAVSAVLGISSARISVVT